MPENTAKNMDEFNAQARSFTTKAKAAGKSNTAIANTVKLMYGMYLEDQKNQITPYQQELLDLEKQKMGDGWEMKNITDMFGNTRTVLFNSKTQEVKELSGDDLADFQALDNDGVTEQPDQIPATPSTVPGLSTSNAPLGQGVTQGATIDPLAEIDKIDKDRLRGQNTTKNWLESGLSGPFSALGILPKWGVSAPPQDSSKTDLPLSNTAYLAQPSTQSLSLAGQPQLKLR